MIVACEVSSECYFPVDESIAVGNGHDPSILKEVTIETLQKIQAQQKELEITLKEQQEELNRIKKEVEGFIIEEITLREISSGQAKTEIKQYFKEHDGETIYPSDIVEALNIDYLEIEKAFEELKNEGLIAETGSV